MLANLVGNAIDAMTHNIDERLLTLRIQRSIHGQHGVPGVRIDISDTGAGIPAAARTKIFEPFFTTKEATGTGLGLWISCEIVRRHQGTLRMRSRTSCPHRGTTFSLFLPDSPGL